MKFIFYDDSVKRILSDIEISNKKTVIIYPGESDVRQPVHTLYGGAHLFKYNSIEKLNRIALKTFLEIASDEKILAGILEWKANDKLNKIIYDKVIEKLNNGAIEDFRIDFEDGFGLRSEKEEDETSEFTAIEFAKAMKNKMLPPFSGIRIKSFSETAKRRAIKTLDIFLTTLINKTGGKIPENFIITLPKVISSEHVKALKDLLELFEYRLNIEPGYLKFEIMLETTQVIFNSEGKINILPLLKEGGNRFKSIHLGLYDFTSSCEISPEFQNYNHPLCNFARQVLKIALSGTGITISDGATNLIPASLLKEKEFTEKEKTENIKAIHNSWKVIYENVFHSLKFGIYQGWDLHPSQIPIRYAAVYRFFLEEFEGVSERMRNFIDKAARATLTGDIFDDAATGQGMLNFISRAYNCGAINEKDLSGAGLTLKDVKQDSVLQIIKSRTNILQ